MVTKIFVPQPQEQVMTCMGELEKYLYAEHTPVLVKAALAHVQPADREGDCAGEGEMNDNKQRNCRTGSSSPFELTYIHDCYAWRDH